MIENPLEVIKSPYSFNSFLLILAPPFAQVKAYPDHVRGIRDINQHRLANGEIAEPFVQAAEVLSLSLAFYLTLSRSLSLSLPLSHSL